LGLALVLVHTTPLAGTTVIHVFLTRIRIRETAATLAVYLTLFQLSRATRRTLGTLVTGHLVQALGRFFVPRTRYIFSIEFDLGTLADTFLIVLLTSRARSLALSATQNFTGVGTLADTFLIVLLTSRARSLALSLLLPLFFAKHLA
jgi:hypothetical protein